MLRRMLMNAVDDTAVTSTIAPAPSETPAANATPVSLSAADITAALASDPSLRNAVMANLRRGGAMSATRAETPATTTATTPQAQPEAAPKPLSVMAELQRIRSLDHARLAANVTATPAQIARMEAAFAAENPTNAAEWAADYVADMFTSIKPPAAPATQPATQPAAAPTQTTPVTNATNTPSSPPPVVDQNSRSIMAMSNGERDELRARIGIAEFTKRMRAELAKVTIKVR